MSIREQNRENRRQRSRGPLMILGTTMTLLYLGLGTALLVDKTLFEGIPVQYRNIFAVLLLVYGLYRGWRVYWDYYRS